jgi:hypothetical protein
MERWEIFDKLSNYQLVKLVMLKRDYHLYNFFNDSPFLPRKFNCPNKFNKLREALSRLHKTYFPIAQIFSSTDLLLLLCLLYFTFVKNLLFKPTLYQLICQLSQI